MPAAIVIEMSTPEARDADSVAEDLGTNDVAVHLLQNNDEDDEIERLQRVDQQNDQRTRHRADERTEHRNDVRHADNRRNQRRIRHLHERHADVAQDADDRRVYDLADDKAREIRLMLLPRSSR